MASIALADASAIVSAFGERQLRTEMDLADASLVWLAADTGVRRVLTLDVRDFARYRLPDGQAFEIL